jgi:hypothetical protein
LRQEYYNNNKEKYREAARKAYHKKKALNPEAIIEYNRNYRLKRLEEDPNFDRRRELKKKYKISLEEWDALFISQNKVCAICLDTEPRSRHGQWHTDHDHISGKVRGILCHNCNTAMGSLKEDKTILLNMIGYLERNA